MVVVVDLGMIIIFLPIGGNLTSGLRVLADCKSVVESFCLLDLGSRVLKRRSLTALLCPAVELRERSASLSIFFLT